MYNIINVTKLQDLFFGSFYGTSLVVVEIASDHKFDVGSVFRDGGSEIRTAELSSNVSQGLISDISIASLKMLRTHQQNI